MDRMIHFTGTYSPSPSGIGYIYLEYHDFVDETVSFPEEGPIRYCLDFIKDKLVGIEIIDTSMSLKEIFDICSTYLIYDEEKENKHYEEFLNSDVSGSGG